MFRLLKLGSIIGILSSLFSCAFFKDDHDLLNGKHKSDYDLSQNIEVCEYIEEEAQVGDVSLSVSRFEGGHWGAPVFSITVRSPSNNVDFYDIVDVYCCDLDGYQIHNLLYNPITIPLVDNTYRYTYVFDEKIEWIYDIYDKFEIRVITENANITFHSWQNYNNINYSGLNVDDYDTSSNIDFDKYLFSEEKSDEDLFDINYQHISGIYIGDLYCFEFLNVNCLCDIVEIYLTDENNNNKVTLCDTPFRVENHTIGLIELTGPGKDYFDSIDNRYKIHIVTSEGANMVYRSYSYMESNKNVEDYNLVNNKEYSAYFTDSIADVGFEASLKEVGKDNTFTLNIFNKSFDYSYDIVEMYFYNPLTGNKIFNIINKPITLISETKNTFSYISETLDNFDSIYDICSGTSDLVIITKDKIMTFYLRYEADDLSLYKSDDNYDINKNESIYAPIIDEDTNYIGYGAFPTYTRKYEIYVKNIFGINNCLKIHFNTGIIHEVWLEDKQNSYNRVTIAKGNYNVMDIDTINIQLPYQFLKRYNFEYNIYVAAEDETIFTA